VNKDDHSSSLAKPTSGVKQPLLINKDDIRTLNTINT